MGQGVNTKMLQVAAGIFSIDPGRVKIESTNTTRVANTSPSAASATADLNGKATELACQAILKRLLNRAAQVLHVSSEKISLKQEHICIDGIPAPLNWVQLVTAAFISRDSLSESAHYATPEIHFDSSVEKGHPFAYHVYGTSIISSTLDCIRGTYEIDSVKVVHDYGKSMNSIIDLGQLEGGIVQGIGWMTLEELTYNADGKLLSNALSTYKVPDIYSVPKEMTILPLETEGHHLAILGSKAVGEPPLMYGIGAYFSIRNAIKAFNPGAEIPFSAPITPEKALMSLYSSNGLANQNHADVFEFRNPARKS
jgi:xanthine dehydrogenase large subunit